MDAIRFHIISAKIFLNRALEDVSSRASSLWYFFFYDVDKKILTLQMENMKMANEINNLKQLKLENDDLRRFLSMSIHSNYSVKIAKVIVFFSSDYMRSCVLDIGSDQDVAIDDIVRDSDGLVGRILEVNKTWSKVLLITDINSNVPVKIGDENVNAIASGNNSNILVISMKHDDGTIKDGDIVETSGFCNVFCDKVPVGKITKKNGIFEVIPFVNFNLLRYVCILKKTS
jgi:rod shape-determining protein MreC